MIRSLTISLFVGLGIQCSAQLVTPVKVDLTGGSSGDRQVTGLAMPVDGTAGVSAAAARTMYTNFAVATGTNALTAALQPALTGYQAGLAIQLVPTQANTGTVTLSVNGLPAVPVMKYVDQALDSADLRPGIPVLLVHDGTIFQVTSQLDMSCPSGSMAFTRDACIATTPEDSLTFWDASMACSAKGGRLCKFTEWMAACHMMPSFLGTVNATEWVDSGANLTMMAKTMGNSTTGTTGFDCKLGAYADPFNTQRFRCCYDR